jgi:hypothetical protein
MLKALGVGDPVSHHLRGHFVVSEHVLENLEPASKVAVQDVVPLVRRRQWLPLVNNRASQVIRSELVLHLPNPARVRAAKEISNHRVGKNTIDEVVDDQAHVKLAACVFEKVEHDTSLVPRVKAG